MLKISGCSQNTEAKVMAIFGTAVMLNGTKTTVLKEGNHWDKFLNNFFAGFCLFCLVIGIVLNPFIIVYHAQQRRTLSKLLFLTISSIDQFRLLYTLSDIIITDYILTDTCFHGHNYSRSAVSGKFFVFRTVKTNFHLNK